MSETPVAVLGLGRLGSAVARRLAERGHDVVTWTRSGRTVDAIPATDSPAAASKDRVVVLCLFDGEACRSVLNEIGTARAVVNISTVSPDEALALAELVEATGADYVHAPVIGSVSAAASGTLKILASPTKPKQVLADLGEVVPCSTPDQAAAAKLLANSVLGSSLLTVRQALSYATALGVPESLTSAVLERTALGGLWRAKRSAVQQDSADFTISALAKDLELLSLKTEDGQGLATAVAVAAQGLAPEDDVAALWRPRVLHQPHQLEVAPEVDTSSSALEPLRHYVAGHATGDPERHRQAFLPTAHVEGLREGVFCSWSLEDYCALFTGQPAPDERQRRRRVDRLTVSGTVGGATMTLWHGNDVFTDEFVLLLVDGRWWIANKAYHRF